MRKILTIALVALMAASLFAGVTTKGYVQGAAHFQKLDKVVKNGQTTDPVLFGEDSDNKAQVSITDENKVWGTTLNAQNTKKLFKTNTWVDVMKLAKVDSDFAAKLVVLTGDKLATLSAYKNNADESNYWRLRNDEADGTSINAQVGYGKYVSAQAGFQIWQGAITEDTRKDQTSFFTSILVTPVDGVKASAGYGIYDFDTDMDAFVVAADVDVAKLAGLDFTFGAGAAYIKGDGSDDGVLTTQVYGEYAGVNAYAEMTFLDAKELKLGAAYQFCDKADAGAYIFFADYDDTEFDENVKIGVEGNYKVAKNISLYGNVEWEAKNINAEARCKVSF